jgi:hypothetical protein
MQPAIWINDAVYTFSSDGLRATMAHELGHILGLHEAYLHDANYSPGSIQCNDLSGSAESVMDSLDIPSPFQVAGPCDATSPQVRDVSLVQQL